MNVPSIHPTLTSTCKDGMVVDWVFQYVPMTDVPFYNVDCYHNEDYQNEPSMKEISLAEVRAFWKGLVDSGFNRK